MPEGENRGRRPRESFGTHYVRGLHTSARGNAAAYGYSVMITCSFGILSTLRGVPWMGGIALFAGGAVVAFALMEAAITGGFRHGLGDEPSSVKALGSSISVLSIGGALAVVYLVGGLPGLAAWPLGSFLATVFYLCAFALEMSVAHVLRARARRARGDREVAVRRAGSAGRMRPSARGSQNHANG